VPYPWCAPIATPTSAPTAPNDLVSYYVEPTFTPAPGSTPTPNGVGPYWYQRGYNQADQMIRLAGPPTGLSVLDFGEAAITDVGPAYNYGARLIHPKKIFIALDQIQQLAGQYADGFYKRAM